MMLCVGWYDPYILREEGWYWEQALVLWYRQQKESWNDATGKSNLPIYVMNWVAVLKAKALIFIIIIICQCWERSGAPAIIAGQGPVITAGQGPCNHSRSGPPDHS